MASDPAIGCPVSAAAFLRCGVSIATPPALMLWGALIIIAVVGWVWVT